MRAVSRALAFVTLVMALPSFGLAQSSRTPVPPQKTTAPPAARHDLDGVWAVKVATTTPRTSFECCLVDPRLRPPMTAWGQARFDAAVPSSKSRSEGDRVIPVRKTIRPCPVFPTVFKDLTSPEPVRDHQCSGPGADVLRKDHGWRQIWTDGQASRRPAGAEVRWLLRWTLGGDTLVVRIDRFQRQALADVHGDPHSEALHLTERYQRLDKRHLVDYGDRRRPPGLHQAMGREANPLFLAAARGDWRVVLHAGGREPLQ